jgi:lipopolysaccharide biosynthesis protein
MLAWGGGANSVLTIGSILIYYLNAQTIHTHIGYPGKLYTIRELSKNWTEEYQDLKANLSYSKFKASLACFKKPKPTNQK